MAEPLRVLIVEDSMEDTFFIVRELQRGGYSVDFERVETQAALQAALESGGWDLVISDHRMPKFDGVTALKVFRDRGLDIPFIVVSGGLGERQVVEMLKAGAHDCVMKDNLARLAPAVRRERQAASERREGKTPQIAPEAASPLSQS